MSFICRRMLWRDRYIMQRFVKVGKMDNLFCYGRTRSSKWQLTQACKKQRCLEGCIKADRNPSVNRVIELNWESSSTTWTLWSVLTSSGQAGSALSFKCRRVVWWNRYLMRRCVEVGKMDNLFCCGGNRSSKWQLAQASKKQWCLEGCIKAGRNPWIELLMASKVSN